MATPPIQMCKDWPPPEDVSDLPAAAFLTSTLWKPGQTITISFIDQYVDAWKKAWVQKTVAEYVQPHVNLKLQFGNYGSNADIRITFAHANQAYSRLGTQSTWYKGSSQQPESMNLGWLDEPHQGSFTWAGQTYKVPGCSGWCSNNQNGSVIIHEFGHALGMVHEHQNPTGGIQWNVEAVLAYFRGSPNFWNDDQIYFNVIDKYDASLLNASSFDPKSIMLYAYPAQLTLNGMSTQANPVMSPTDILWMRKVYGKPGGVETKVVGEVNGVGDVNAVSDNVSEVDGVGELSCAVKIKKTPLIILFIVCGVISLGVTITFIHRYLTN